MSANIGMSLTTTKLEVAAGESVETTITITNQGQIVDHFAIKVEGLDPTWWTLSTRSVSLFPGDKDQATLTIHPPKDAEAKAGSYSFSIKATSQANAEVMTTEEAYLILRGFVVWEVNMTPTRISGRKGNYRLTVSNSGNTDINLIFEGKDPEEGLLYNFSHEKITVPAGGNTQAQVTVRPKKGQKGKQYSFQILTRPEESKAPAKETKTVNGQLEYPRRNKLWWWWIPLVVLLVLAAAAFAVWWFFFIPRPTIDISTPNGGEVWTSGSTKYITWTSTEPENIDAVNLEYSTDGGSSWLRIAMNEPNDGTAPWQVPTIATDTCKVKATILDNTGKVMGDDTSDSFFTIELSATAALTSPGGGEIWQTGDTHDITWDTTQSEAVATIDLEYSTDEGTNWSPIAMGQPNSGSYSWTIPGGQSETCQIRITIRSDSGEVLDQYTSEGSFAITPPRSATISAPTPGTFWVIGSSQEIKWGTMGLGIASVDLQYSTVIMLNPSQGWSSIATGERNDGSYQWIVPNVESETCRVKIILRDAEGNVLSQSTSGTFKIGKLVIKPLLPPIKIITP